MRPGLRPAACLVCALAVFGWDLRAPAPDAAGGFASEIARLSEPGGRFDTDNLISNERHYLDVIPTLVADRVSGGAYIGVGPDQNFSYIARTRPAVAYIIDLRRDNLLLHLLFKALFAGSTTRVEYLSLLTGRDPPPALASWRHATIAEITRYVDATPPVPAHVEALRRRLEAAVDRFGVRLSSADVGTIDRFHRAFIDKGLDLQFESYGRPPRPGYPTLRELLLATDAAGRPWNYLASEDDFRFVKALEAHDRVIPVVGNVAGVHAMRAIAEAIPARGQRVSAFYISNIETYLYRTDQMAQLAANVERLPKSAHSVLIRSVFAFGGTSRMVVEPLAAAPSLR